MIQYISLKFTLLTLSMYLGRFTQKNLRKTAFKKNWSEMVSLKRSLQIFLKAVFHKFYFGSFLNT